MVFYVLFCLANHHSLLCHQCTSDNRGRRSGITTIMRTTYSNNDITNSSIRKETTASTTATIFLQWKFWVNRPVIPSSAYFRSANLLLVLLIRDKCCQTALSNTTYYAYHDHDHILNMHNLIILIATWHFQVSNPTVWMGLPNQGLRKFTTAFPLINIFKSRLNIWLWWNNQHNHIMV